MNIGLLLNSNGRLCVYSEKFRDILVQNNIEFQLIDPNSSLLLNNLKDCTHLIFRPSMGDTDKLIYDAIFYIAQNKYNIKCYPNFDTLWPHENKIKEYYLLKSHGFPIIDSYIFWTYDNARAFLHEAQFPVVAKLPKGAGSSNVILINSVKEGRKIIKHVFNRGVKSSGFRSRYNLTSITNVGLFKYSKYIIKSVLINSGMIKDKSDYPKWQIQKDAILFQKYLPDNTSDTRVTVIGDKAFAFRRFVRKNDFRASGSGKFDLDPGKIDTKCIKLAFTISAKLNFDVMAYDFIYDKDKKPWINEISCGFIDWVVHSCPGYYDNNLKWHDGHFWPQQLQLQEFLGNNKLHYSQ